MLNNAAGLKDCGDSDGHEMLVAAVALHSAEPLSLLSP